ncbi:MAG: transcription antitermination factor NusB, partial [Vicinamibacterales bacterium]
LYQWEVSQLDVEAVVRTYPFIEQEGDVLSPAAAAFAADLVRRTVSQLAQLDALIVDQAEHWRIERMPMIDRLILRMALCEMLERETPHPVVIDEALELARAFSAEPAVKFVNGVLDGVSLRLRAAERADASSS